MKKDFEGYIQKIENRWGVNLSYFLGNGFWVAFRYGFVGGLGLLLTAGFARWGTKELLGQYQYVLSVFGLLSLFTLPGLNMVAVREVSRGNAYAVVQAVLESFRWGWFASFCAILYSGYLFFSGEISLGITFFIGGLLAPFFYAPNTWYAFYEGDSRFKPVTARIVCTTFVVTFSLLAALFFQWGLVSLIVLFFGLTGILYWIFFLEIFKKTGVAKTPLDRRYGLWCTVQKFAVGLSDALPPILLAFFFGFEVVAVYQIAYLPFTLLSGFVSALSALYLPILFRSKERGYGKLLFFHGALGCLLFGGVALFLSFFFIPLFGETYRVSLYLAWAFSALGILYPFRIFLANFFSSQNKNNLVIAVSLFSNILAMGVLFFLRKSDAPSAMLFYIYTLHIAFLLPLFGVYFWRASKRIVSMRSAL